MLGSLPTLFVNFCLDILGALCDDLENYRATTIDGGRLASAQGNVRILAQGSPLTMRYLRIVSLAIILLLHALEVRFATATTSHGAYMKRLSVVLPFLAILLAGCKTQSVVPLATPQTATASSTSSGGGILMSPGALIEQEHHDRVERIRRLAERYDIPPPSVDQQLILPASLFGTDRDVPVIRIAWSERSFFDTDSDIPRSESATVLATLAEAVRNDLPDTHLLVVGHTDARGTETYNQDLSLRRSENVAHRLVGLGVNERQITYMGMGKMQPVASNMTSEGMSQNRRVEFFLGAYAEVTIEAVGRVPVNSDHHRLASAPSHDRTAEVADIERSINAYTPHRNPISPDVERDLADGESGVSDQGGAGTRRPDARQLAKEVTVGGRERTVDLPALVYREPVIGSRGRGF